MPFESVRTYSFRNLFDSEICTTGKEVFLIGENGQGKTSFLEALYFCSFASSFKASKDTDMIKNGSACCSAAASLTDSLVKKINIRIENGKKVVTLDRKAVDDRKELLQIVPSIVFCHDDMEFVAGPPEKRRWFFDQTLTLLDISYIDEFRKYRKILKTKNALLKEGSSSTLDLIDYQIAISGIELMKIRKEVAEWFSIIFNETYEKVAGIDGILVSYVPSWKTFSVEKIIEFLTIRRASDQILGASMTGPHRDRYVFKKDGAEFSGPASTGQRRLLALLLRVAQAKIYSQRTGKVPVLLLDDVLLELDPEKKLKFIHNLPEYQQAFFTFLPGEPYDRYRKDTTLMYQVKEGCIIK